MIKLGSHVSMNGDKMFVASVEETLSYEANTMMIYTGAPQNTRRKAISKMRIDEALQMMRDNDIDPSDVVVHAPYIMNLANKDSEKRQFAVDFLTEEVKRSAAMGAPQIVLHPGAHVKQGVDTAIEYIAEGLNQVFENTKGLPTLIALETMSGKGTEIGRNFEELKAIIDRVEDSDRLSVCFDTCHTHDAGYDVALDFDGVMETFDRIVGLERISVFHINDSKNPRGASKDRHENIGFGYIGFDALNHIVHHKDFQQVPKVLETPYLPKNPDDKKRIYAPYKEEIAMLKAQTFDPQLKDKIRAKHTD